MLSLFNTNILYNIEHTHVKNFFTQVFRIFIFFGTLVTKSGAEGMLFPVMLEV